MNRPFLALSHSQVKASFCPALWQARYLLASGPEPTSRQALKGTLGHKIAEEYIPALFRTRKTSDLDLYTDILMRVIEPYDDEIRESVMAVGEHFVHGFQLKKNAIFHRTEVLLAMDREFNPIAVTAVGAPGEMPPNVSENETPVTYLWDDALHRVIDPPCDGYTGKIDYVCAFKGGKEVDIYDWKMGLEFVTELAVNRDPQGIGYACLWFANHPECQVVNFVKWGVRFGPQNKASARWTREMIYDTFQTRLDLAFARLDACFEAFGTDGKIPWVPLPNTASCEYCSVALQCAKNNEAAEWLQENGPIQIPRRKPMRKPKEK